MATPSDVERWEREDRDDILAFADTFMRNLAGRDFGADLWFSPVSGEELDKCPFLKRSGKLYQCAIHEARPEVCRRFPHLEYDEQGRLVSVHFDALENCPGVQELLAEMSPEEVEILQDRVALERAP